MMQPISADQAKWLGVMAGPQLRHKRMSTSTAKPGFLDVKQSHEVICCCNNKDYKQRDEDQDSNCHRSHTVVKEAHLHGRGSANKTQSVSCVDAESARLQPLDA